jgi:hypothetical protein
MEISQTRLLTLDEFQCSELFMAQSTNGMLSDPNNWITATIPLYWFAVFLVILLGLTCVGTWLARIGAFAVSIASGLIAVVCATVGIYLTIVLWLSVVYVICLLMAMLVGLFLSPDAVVLHFAPHVLTGGWLWSLLAETAHVVLTVLSVLWTCILRVFEQIFSGPLAQVGH